MAGPIRLDTAGIRAYEPPERVFDRAKEEGSFADVFKKALTDATEIQGHAGEMIQAFLRGDPVELHEVMAASQEAAISLELLVEMRNKLTEAYRSVMNIQ